MWPTTLTTLTPAVNKENTGVWTSVDYSIPLRKSEKVELDPTEARYWKVAGACDKYADFTIRAFCFRLKKHWVHASMVMRFDISGLKKLRRIPNMAVAAEKAKSWWNRITKSVWDCTLLNIQFCMSAYSLNALWSFCTRVWLKLFILFHDKS